MEFLKNIMEVDVDGLRSLNHYTIKAMYNKNMKDDQGEYCDIVYITIDEFDYTWADISRDGGIFQVNEEIKKCYNIDI